jgi:thiamine pyrophosphate-dependent acetolactate synthase large subunit-like protein
MAHAHAELTGELGVAMVTAGPGVTNTITAVANASLARAPVLVIGGCTSRAQANMGPLQDIPHVDILRPVTRQSRTLRVADQLDRTTFSKADVYPPVEERYRDPARDWLDLTNGRNVLRVAK